MKLAVPVPGSLVHASRVLPGLPPGAGTVRFLGEGMTYQEKLRDPRWQKRRLEVLNRDGFTCLVCESKERTLHVHHLAYHPSGNPWYTPLALLETLCEDCHNARKEYDAIGGMLPSRDALLSNGFLDDFKATRQEEHPVEEK